MPKAFKTNELGLKAAHSAKALNELSGSEDDHVSAQRVRPCNGRYHRDVFMYLISNSC